MKTLRRRRVKERRERRISSLDLIRLNFIRLLKFLNDLISQFFCLFLTVYSFLFFFFIATKKCVIDRQSPDLVLNMRERGRYIDIVTNLWTQLWEEYEKRDKNLGWFVTYFKTVILLAQNWRHPKIDFFLTLNLTVNKSDFFLSLNLTLAQNCRWMCRLLSRKMCRLLKKSVGYSKDFFCRNICRHMCRWICRYIFQNICR
jgi:hypothetical protein